MVAELVDAARPVDGHAHPFRDVDLWYLSGDAARSAGWRDKAVCSPGPTSIGAVAWSGEGSEEVGRADLLVAQTLDAVEDVEKATLLVTEVGLHHGLDAVEVAQLLLAGGPSLHGSLEAAEQVLDHVVVLDQMRDDGGEVRALLD